MDKQAIIVMRRESTMHSELQEIFRQERGRVFMPPAGFGERVLHRLEERPVQSQTFWDTVFAAGWPVLAATVAGLLILVGMQMMLPATPNRGLSEIYAESVVPPAERAIYMDVDTPPPPVVFEQLISVDEQ